MLDARKCIIILGSGASMDAGLPSATRLGTELFYLFAKLAATRSEKKQSLIRLVESEIEGKSIQIVNKYLDRLKAAVCCPNEAPIDAKVACDILYELFDWNSYHQFKQRNFPDVESILQAFELVRWGPGPFGSKHLARLLNSKFQDRAIRARCEHALSMARLYTCMRLLDIPGDPSYLANLKQFRSPKGDLHIFSINYDLCVEQAFASIETPIETGFNKKGILCPNRFKKAYGQIRLIKLHGSLDWGWKENGNICKSPSNTLPEDRKMPSIILGGFNKDMNIFPWEELFDIFKKTIVRAGIIIAIGYSFRDAHINHYIRLAQKKNTKVIYISPHSKEYSDDQDEKQMSDLIPLQEGARMALANNKLLSLLFSLK